jgi:serine/threonine-protein kinase
MDSQVMLVPYAVQGDSFVAEKPRPWSGKRLANVGLWRNYDLAPDGKHIAALMPAGSSEGEQWHHVIFLLNFFDELRRRAPVK